jgi:catechol 2,3-dioxygenase-like lactoylglutathione lyase family enzyme
MRGLAFFAAGMLVGTVLMQTGAAQENRNTGFRLNHVGIAVKDVKESVDFYTKVMGFRVAYSLPNPNGNPTTTFLQINRDTFLEVAQSNANLPVGLTHMGIWSEDSSATVAQLRQAGATAPDPRPGGPSGSRLVNITDPNGIRIEINEQPVGSLMRKAMDAWK